MNVSSAAETQSRFNTAPDARKQPRHSKKYDELVKELKRLKEWEGKSVSSNNNNSISNNTGY